MSIGEGLYGLCSLAFLALIALMLARGRISTPGVAIITACGLSALWAADLALPGLFPRGASAVFGTLRLSAWLILIVALISPPRHRQRGWVWALLFLTICYSAIVIGVELGLLHNQSAHLGAPARFGDLLHVGLNVGGLLAVENLLRNSEGTRRRHLWPLCLAFGATFAFELFLYVDRVMIPGSSPILAEGRVIIGLLSIPLLAIAMARNRDWRVDIHVSRTVVLHTAALVATGMFFLALSILGVVVRELDARWGPMLQLLTLVGSAVVLASVLGSRNTRIHVKQLIAKNFFSHRFDYRTEWLRFVDTVSTSAPGKEDLRERVVRALAQIVDSPAGTLWRMRAGGSYAAEAGWNLTVKTRETLASDDPFISGFCEGELIQERPADSDSVSVFGFPDAWIAIPLSHGEDVIAFVVLARPNRSFRLDSETFDLLRTAGRQAASYLAEEQATRALSDSQLLNDYGKRFAFVVHDMKNVSSQLALLVANAAHHLDNPDFRRDMLFTLEESVARLKGLVGRLHGGTRDPELLLVEPDAVITSLTDELSRAGNWIETELHANECVVLTNADEFRSVLHHLINNALEAAPCRTPVRVMTRNAHGKFTVDIHDSGPGMDDEFVRDELFRPFRSTKPGGLGIGAYQTRELLRTSGGELDVFSQKGRGTTMRVTLPMHSRAPLVQSAA